MDQAIIEQPVEHGHQGHGPQQQSGPAERRQHRTQKSQACKRCRRRSSEDTRTGAHITGEGC